VLKTRLSERLDPNRDLNKDLVYPKTEDLDFSNPIIGLKAKNHKLYGFNYLMKNGDSSNFIHVNGAMDCGEFRLEAEQQVTRVIL
jgi:hypothetical protein